MCCVVIGAAMCLAERAAEDLLQFKAILHLDLVSEVPLETPAKIYKWLQCHYFLSDKCLSYYSLVSDTTQQSDLAGFSVHEGFFPSAVLKQSLFCCTRSDIF